MADLRWGIMGTGDIARSMVACLRERGSPIVAVGSARPGAAAAFASTHDIPHALDSHDAVAEHPEVDVVYVGTTNDKHLPNVLACIASQTPVLCEKPIALDADEASRMLGAATATGVFAMEAMWMRFHPFLAQLDALVASGAIGELRTIMATLGFSAPIDVDRRWLSRELGGGSILDLGVYPMTLIHHFAGSPLRFVADGLVGPTGVDLEASVISRHANDVSASWISTFRSDTPNEAVISGSDGRVRVSAPFHHSPLLTLERGGDVVDRFPIEVDVHGFEFQVAETERCISEGLVESPVRPHRDTLAVMEWMDAIRAQVGVTYPSQNP
ncbi:MAG: Gfo/Idh/MocA family oxidoreductase [Acidimicrobiia bacterium]|nr:Gfo/Idh/MocA family oxidoreductase [Acidimicrobiia bacterium]